MLNHIGTMDVETDRLILRKFKADDAKDMYNNWASDPEVTKYMTWKAHTNIDVTKGIIDSWINSYENKEYYQWAIVLKDTNTIIGSISLLNINNKTYSCEAGYCIGRDFWNKGIVTEAFKTLIHIGFTEIGFERITARHNTLNPASGKVMLKCGLSYEGLFRKYALDNTGNLVDIKYYSVLKDEYENVIQC
ncbi:GNAT family N-acetyltransferase [Clostridiaceae bacterium M8S5]|nr:GNAT family N-acetyltransferase [Clostridiaceae bacterium M8S5]